MEDTKPELSAVVEEFRELKMRPKSASLGESSMEKGKAKLLAVAEEFRELDLMFRSGSDLDDVARGYARKLIDAICRQDNALKCEALKSLGDVYLHKAKINENKVNNFHKACALYKKVLRYRRRHEDKQVLQHRIKYAEKCTNLVHDQNRGKSEIETSANITLAVSMTLHELTEKAQKKGQDLTPLIQAYTGSFLRAIVDRNSCMEIESLKSLGDLYIEKGMFDQDEAAFTKTVGLYRAALDRCEDSDRRETLKHRIKYAEKVNDKAAKKRQERLVGKRTAENDNILATSRESSSHVIKYTEKVKGHEIKKRQGTGLPRSRQADKDNRFTISPASPTVAHDIMSQRSSERTYQDHLQEGCRALQTGDMDRAEGNFAAALKAVHVTGQHGEETEPLCKLSDVYQKRGILSKDGGDFTKAAALCNAALVRSKTEDREGIKQAIQAIIPSFLKHVLGIEGMVDIPDAEKHKLMLTKDRDYVEEEMKRIEEQADPYSLDDDDPKMREVETRRAEEIKTLCQTIVGQRKTFISGLVDECMEAMGSPPCKYAMIGLGSQATGLVTPYSDLEFAILIEEETENNVSYFRNLTHYLHLKVINLGETILPAMGIKSLNDFFSQDPIDNWYYDSVTPRGFAFDGAMPHACKTPLGRGENRTVRSELIQTPSKMTDILQADLAFHLKKSYHLASILGNVCLIKGNQALVDEYAVLWEQCLQRSNGAISRLIAKLLLIENAPTFQVKILNASLMNVKKEMYRFSSLSVSFLALLHNVQPTTIWETIEKLNDNRVIDSENAHHLKVLVNIAAELRLRTYMNNRGQVENMSALGALSSIPRDTNIVETLKKVFYFSNTKQLMRYYYTATPLKLFLSQSFTQSGVSPTTIFDNSASLKAEVYHNLCDYKKAISCYEQALQMRRSIYGEDNAHPDIATSLNDLGNAWGEIGDNRKAATYLEQSLHMRQTIYSKNSDHPDIAKSLNDLGAALGKLGDKKAVVYLERALQIMRSIHGEDAAHRNIATSLENLGVTWGNLGDYKNALSYHEQAKQMRRSVHDGCATHANIADSLHNLSTAWNQLGDHKKAIGHFEQSLEMRRSIYGENTAHPDIAASLNSLGACLAETGEYKKAISYFEESLPMFRLIHGENTVHHEIATSLHNLGTAYGHLGDYIKAVSYLEQSVQMKRRIHGENTAHPEIVGSLNNLGSHLNKLGEDKRAVTYHEQALQMLRSIHGENTAHHDIARSLSNLGVTYLCLGDHIKSLRYHKQALHMLRSIHGENIAHTDIAASLSDLGTTWSKLADHRKAVSYLEESAEMMRCIYGESTARPEIGTTLNNLGTVWSDLGDHRKAIGYHEQSLQMFRSVYGGNTAHPDIVKVLSVLGVAEMNLGNHRKAVTYLERALQMLRSIHGEDTAHPHIAMLLNILGVVWCNGLADYKKAVHYFEESLQMRRIIYGENTAHPDIAESLSNLSAAWSKLGDHRKTASYSERALQMLRSIHGEDTAHPDIATLLNRLGVVCCNNIDDNIKAVHYFEESLKMRRVIYGESTAHPDIAKSLKNLGASWYKRADYRKAVKCFEESLQMWRVVHGKSAVHPDIAEVLSYLEQSRQMSVLWTLSGNLMERYSTATSL